MARRPATDDGGTSGGGGGRNGGHRGGLGPEFYDEQARAIEDRLRRHLDERLSGLAASGTAPGGAAAVEAGWRRWRPEIYAGILLLLLVLFTWPPSIPGIGGGADETEKEESEQGDNDEEEPALPQAGETPVDVPDDPQVAWAEFVETNRAELALWARAVAEARGLAENEVSSIQKGAFDRYAKTLGGDGALTPEQLGYLRTGLFEYLYGRWHVLQGGTVPDGFVVNQQFAGYDAATLRQLGRSLGLPENLSVEDPPGNATLQYLVVTRTVALEEPPPA